LNVTVPTTPGTLNLSWSDNSTNEDGFKIERSTDNKAWTQITTVGLNVRTHVDSGLISVKTYYYRVRAFNRLGNSSYSNMKSAKTR
jgi:uncharacterized protein